VPFKKVTADRMTAAIDGLLSDPGLERACATTAARFAEVDPFGAACDQLVAYAESLPAR
jgi:hypothetical protein